MKKIAFLMTAAAAVLISCQREEMEVIQPAEPTGYVYHFGVSEGETKATLGDDGVFWAAGDQVGLYPGTTTSVAASVNTSATPKTVTFSSDSPLEVGTSIYSYYPYQAGNTDASATKIVFPTVQTGGSDSAMPMAGVPFRISGSDNGTDGVIRFRNLGAVIDFRVYSAKYAGEQVKSVTFTAASGTNPVSGDATVDLTGIDPNDEATLAVTWPANAANPSSVTLLQSTTVAASKDAAAEGHLYMVVAPGTYASGTITVVTNAATYTFPFTDQTLVRNSLKRFNMNLESANATRDIWYVKVNSMEEMVDGGKYLIVYENGPYAFKPIRNNNQLDVTSNNRLSVTVNNDRILSTEAVDACQVVFEEVSNGSGYYMKAVFADGYYFYPSSSTIAASSTATTSCTVTNNSGVVNITAGSNRYFKYSTSSNCFKPSTYNSSRELALYLLDEGTTEYQHLRFSEVSVTYILNDQPLPVVLSNTPILSGYQTEVTYTSSNTAVATVDATTGFVTMQGTGKTVITATAAASDDYLQGTASYTLSVWNEPTYSIENDMVAGYLDYVETHPYGPSYPSDYTTSWVTMFSTGTGENNRLDWPKPVPVSWENPTTGNTNKTVVIYNDADHTDPEMEVSVSSTSATTADIYNLIPGRTFWYVVKNGDTDIASGHFATTGRRRMIKVGESQYGQNHANNCRDLGGLITVDGKMVKYGKIFRGSNMDDTPKNNDQYGEKAFLLNYLKIGLDVDLRESSGSNPLGVTVSDETYNSIGNLTDKGKMKVTIGDILDAVLDGTGVYIHCKVGADRTGYVCMLLEAILGVRQDLCDTDYELTSFSGAVGTRRRSDTSASYYYYPRGIEFIYQQDGTTFQEKAVNYVVNELGIPLTEVQAFQNEMLEDI